MKVTESESNYQHLDKMPTHEILQHINQEDSTVPIVVATAIPAIERLVEVIARQLSLGGRLFYLGAGTSGRLGIVDASECPPTYGVPQGLVIGLIAGGDGAIRQAVEFAEDNTALGWADLQLQEVSSLDVVVGIAASGSTPYVLGALNRCNEEGIATGCIVCNPDSAIAAAAQYPIEVVTGPEVVTGSTRMKAGTAQKLVLNMISTTVMIKIGRVAGNRMVNMQLSNDKLIDRGTRMVQEATGLSVELARVLLLQEGSVKAAIDRHQL
jgi:N-acetylmuramic acid 6-phosphate etherase